MTESERAIILELGRVWDRFMQLSVEHPLEKDEFCKSLHGLQNMILARSARRNFGG